MYICVRVYVCVCVCVCVCTKDTHLLTHEHGDGVYFSLLIYTTHSLFCLNLFHNTHCYNDDDDDDDDESDGDDDDDAESDGDSDKGIIFKGY